MDATTKEGLSRRRMMLVTGGAVAGASVLLAAPVREKLRSVARGVFASDANGRRLLSLAYGTYEDWLNVVGTNFSLGGRLTLRLTGVRALQTSGAKPAGVRAQAFAAFFDPQLGMSVAPDLIYTATHSRYGPMPLYLASAEAPLRPRRMVAIFN